MIFALNLWVRTDLGTKRSSGETYVLLSKPGCSESEVFPPDSVRNAVHEQRIHSGSPAALSHGRASEPCGRRQHHQKHPLWEGVVYSPCVFGYQVALTKPHEK